MAYLRSIFSKRQSKVAPAPNVPEPPGFTSSGSFGIRVPLAISAFLLVIASAGFGMTFAYQQAAHHGMTLAMLAVAMALGLEVAKPFAVEGVFDCLRRFAVGRALALFVLATVAIGYSLTAELSLMASTRGDAAAGREAVADARQLAKERHRRAAAELAKIGTARPAGELTALLGGADCEGRTNTRTRTLCGELARAERRAELEAVLAKSEADVTSRPAVGTADAGAVALSTVLSMFGVTMPAGALASWLVLVAVISLETGSSLAVVLVRGMAPASPVARPVMPVHEMPPHVEAAPVQPAVEPATPRETASVAEPAAVVKKSQGRRGRPAKERQEAEIGIVGHLRANGGSMPASVRKLAKATGASKGTVVNALAGLIAAGAVVKVGAGLALAG